MYNPRKKPEDSPESSEVQWDKGTSVMFFFSILEVANQEGEIV